MTMYHSTSSLEPHPIQFALIPPLKASLVSVRSCDNGLDDDTSSNANLASGTNSSSRRRLSRPSVTFNRADRRKSVSTPAISRLVPTSYLYSHGTIPENRLLHQSSLRARSCSPLGRSKTCGSKGRLSDGSSFGDLMNSGEFHLRGSSIRCCSPIALSMVKSMQSSSESFCRQQRLDHCPTIAIDSPDGSMCMSPARSLNILHTTAEESDVSSFGSCSAYVDVLGGVPCSTLKPSFMNEDGSVFGELSLEQRRELHEYLTCKQKHLAQKAMVNIFRGIFNLYVIDVINIIFLHFLL